MRRSSELKDGATGARLGAPNGKDIMAIQSGVSRRAGAHAKEPSVAEDSAWSPPDFAEERQTRIGASVVEEFVSGHDASDVLRELVQNEFDGGGDQLVVDFGNDALRVIGNGRGVSADGWQRLSVIVGTGRVVGAGAGERVDAKANGIGSKNFGLRSLFIFGDEIYVRSRGSVAVLDLRTLETGKVRDPRYWGGPGVRIQVPFRQQPFEMLEPFTADREAMAFNVMADGMLATLVKLALPGRRIGLRGVTLRSARCNRELQWKQGAESLRSPMKSVSVVRRRGRLIDTSADKSQRLDFEEFEFSKTFAVPDEHRDIRYPSYFDAAGGRIKIGVSLPVKPRKLDFSARGYFHYPLQAPDSATGCLVSVSAPFFVNNDRSALTDHRWNDWLIEQAAEFVADLIAGDWFQRFGAGAFRALVKTEHGNPTSFVDRVLGFLAERECWPTRQVGELAKASLIVLPEDPLLDGFLSADRYLHPVIAEDEIVRKLAADCGAARFSLSALVRLRCAGDDATQLQTKLKQGEGNWRFTQYDVALKDLDRQVRMATSLSALAKRLSPQNRADLQATPSTLSAAGALRPARELILVAPEIWNVSHEPMENRLHPALAPHRAISAACRPFDEQSWIVEACNRAAAGTISEIEHEALYAHLLDDKAAIGRRALAAIRRSPVVRSQRGDWIAPDRMVHLKGALAKLMAPVVQAPSEELLKASLLMSKLKIREQLAGEDLVAFAEDLANRPSSAQAFERVLARNVRVITPGVRDVLFGLPFLLSKAGSMERPKDLHFDTSLNRTILNRDSAIVGGANQELYRRLGVAEHPSVAVLLEILEWLKARDERPACPDLIYPALVDALKRERRARNELKDRAIIWWNDSFHAPSSILVGPRIPRVLDLHLAVQRRLDQIAFASLSLGAREFADDGDWRRFFTKVCGNWDREPVSGQVTRALNDAYAALGPAGLPSGLDDLECLLTRDGYLYSLDELRGGELMENDFPVLADALDDSDVDIGIVDITEKNAAFFHRLRIRPLSSLTGAGAPVFGAVTRQPNWYKQFHDERILEMLRRPIFARALHAVAVRRRHMYVDYAPIELSQLEVVLTAIEGVAFYESIVREYRAGSAVARVPVEAAVNGNLVGLVSPRTRLDFQQLFAQALAELTGARNVDLVRTLSTDILPLVLARTPDEIVGWLERVGVFLRGLGRLDETGASEPGEPIDHEDDDGENVIRQVMSSLNTQLDHQAPPTPLASPERVSIPIEVPQVPKLPPLPPLDEVRLSVEDPSGRKVESSGGQYHGGYGYGGWSPPTGAEVERDQEIGRRGEALVYRMEIERVRKQGHPNPEQVVIWTSAGDPGADHDICSIDEAGNPRWIEVKSTTGTDGRFEWPRKEFEKAFRERERYELWRVYRAAGTDPVAKCFENPSNLMGDSRLYLELASLRAIVEGIT